MKVMTILGTRPEIIRLSCLIPLLDAVCDHVLVDTQQNFDPRLGELFYEELAIRAPNRKLGCRADSPMGLVAKILTATEAALTEEKPDRLLLLGDTYSALSAFAAKRMGIPVYHMEAGNRCYDDRVPEEINRRIVDHCSDVLMPYTERSRANLLREGLPGPRIFVTGNPIGEVIARYEKQIAASAILANLKIERGQFFLATVHRAENVDHPERLETLLDALVGLATRWKMPVICSLHPRTRSRLSGTVESYAARGLRMEPPFGFFDFIMLEKSAFCVLSDSGTVQEECALFGTPSLTLRDVTERPETLECGSNILAGASVERIAAGVELATKFGGEWTAPVEYLKKNVSATVAKITLGRAP